MFYGWRSPVIQQESFETIKRQLGLTERDDIDALEIIHKSIAVPEVAGHPTGGAVDVQLVTRDKKIPVDMGTERHNFSEDSYTFSPFINPVAKTNRSLLRAAMLKAGFAPFDGEWWHFSYGDREWAAWYKQPESLYSPILI